MKSEIEWIDFASRFFLAMPIRFFVCFSKKKNKVITFFFKFSRHILLISTHCVSGMLPSFHFSYLQNDKCKSNVVIPWITATISLMRHISSDGRTTWDFVAAVERIIKTKEQKGDRRTKHPRQWPFPCLNGTRWHGDQWFRESMWRYR